MFKRIGDQLSLSDKIEVEIEDAIRHGRLSPGEKLPTESELCSQFSVSRTAVREAIGKLNARGLITVKKGSGIYVDEISYDRTRQALNLFFELSTMPDLAIQTIDARLIMEPQVAAFAARVRSSAHIDNLEENQAKMISCKIGDLEREAELDNEFHSEIIASTGNPVIALLMRPVYSLMPKYRQKVFAKSSKLIPTDEKEILIGFHGEILKSIKERNGQKAYDTMAAHLEHTKKNYLEF
ncbi:FadR/GntR family transcriptional regulator [Fulvivirgaceae bacterium BMA12]|uniref:FadR/GntR family transcriptional regulator n=1 Tax=Agaribacillus aureus TaxID=3051825 RepID=A0ABT8LDQ8_9BACT|nr:FadR/GntR family transcriptional regulator [Fulvivirgaceae bacterium BMA12]